MLKNSIDKIVKDKLNGMEIEPPEYVWTSINQRILDGKHRKRILLYWQSVAAIALLILSIGVVYFATNGTARKKQMANVEKRTTVKDSEADKVVQKDYVARNNVQQTVITSSVVKSKADKTNQISYVNKESNAAEIAIEGNDVVAKQQITVYPGKISEEVYLSKLDYLSISTAKESLPDAKIIMVDKHTFQKSEMYAYNVEIPTYNSNTKKYKFILGGSVSPTYNYRSIDESQNSYVVHSTNDFPANETGVISVSGGVNIRMEGKSRWSFETGVLYSQVGQEVSNSTTYSSIAAVTSANVLYSDNSNDISVSKVSGIGNSLGEIHYNNNTSLGVEKNFQKSGVYLAAPLNTYESASEITIKQLLDYIEIPLMIRYAVFNNKPLITLAGGFSTNFLVDNTAYVIENGESINAGETEGINSISYSSTLGIGLELPLGKSFRFSLEPRFKYYITPVNSQAYNSFRPYSFGVFGGVSFIINNH